MANAFFAGTAQGVDGPVPSALRGREPQVSTAVLTCGGAHDERMDGMARSEGAIDMDAVAALDAAGWTLGEVAVGIGCSARALRAAAREAGVCLCGMRRSVDPEEVRGLARAGATLLQAAEAMGVSRNAARVRAYRLGVKFARTPRKDQWGEGERATLREVYPLEGAQAAANALGRTVYAVYDEASRLGLRRVFGSSLPRTDTDWDPHEVAALCEAWGSPLGEVAADLGRDAGDVARKARGLGVRLAP